MALARCGLALTLLLAPGSAAAQDRAPEVWSLPANERQEALVDDARVLRQALEELHPGLFRYQTTAQWDASCSALEASLERDPTLPGAFLAISQFVNTLRCGHAHCNFLNQPTRIAEALLRPAPRVPFHFRWIDRRMVVLQNHSSEARLVPGAEILSIDKVPVGDILDRLMTIARADGGNDAKRRDYLGVSGGSEFEAFDIYLPLFFPGMRGPFALEVRSPVGERFAARVNALTGRPRVVVNSGDAAPPGRDAPAWQWSMLDQDTALLRMSGWALFNSNWDWSRWLGEHLDELVRDRTPNLVVDLRGNEGGLDCGDLITARLIDAPLPRSDIRPFVRYRKTPVHLDRHLDTWDDSFRDWGDAAKPAATPAQVAHARQSYYRLTKYDEDVGSGIVAVGPRYEGRVYVLVDAACSSATFQFAQTMKKHDLAMLVGQTTGGNQRGINGGAFFFLRLPNSGIEVDVPLIGTFPGDDAAASQVADAGIEPDVLVTPSVADVAAGIDRELETVRRLIRERK